MQMQDHYVDHQQVNPSQTACLAGTYNPNTGSTRSVDCLESIVGYHVFQHRDQHPAQTACLAGTYQVQHWYNSSCSDADAGSYVVGTRSI